MKDSQNTLHQLLLRLESLMEKQAQFHQELERLKSDIKSYQNIQSPHEQATDAGKFHEIPFKAVSDEPAVGQIGEKIEGRAFQEAKPAISSSSAYGDPKPTSGGFNWGDMAHPTKPRTEVKSNIEKFVGENLINKIGIAITVIGVGIGAKYSIENELISPLTRIILGYLFGLGLIGCAMWLKGKYENFSAVILSGGMATLYLITFAAYNFYGLIPLALTFVLMVAFTAFTVLAALHYNNQVIAHIGLVGAYAVPFLLSDGSGRVAVLFSYMTVINTGILMVAMKRYWKPLYYAAFFFTWIIFMAWYFDRYNVQEHFWLALSFLSVFFAIFYLAFLSYKAIKKEQFGTGDVMLLLLNSFIFYGLGYAALTSHPEGEQFLGLFTLLNALVHFGVSFFIYRRKLADKNLFYFLAGLVLVFVAIAVPVQLDGSWVTLLWVGQALLLFWIGRKNKIPLYEVLSYPMMILAFISILHDWSGNENFAFNYVLPIKNVQVIFNIQFLTALIFIVAFPLIQYLNSRNNYISQFSLRESLRPFFGFIIPSILLIVAYFSVRMEVERYWDQQFVATAVVNTGDTKFGYNTSFHDYNLISLKNIWVINYSLLFLIFLTWAQILRIKSKSLETVLSLLHVLAIAVFLFLGLYLFGELRESYINQLMAEYFHRDSAHLPVRYISLTLFGGLLFSYHKMVSQKNGNDRLRVAFDYILHISVLWVASSELINWLELMGSSQSYKLGLSILWGIYALLLIVLGIWKKKKHLRLAAIGLFGVTLFKLFFYDIIHLDTIAKTVVFVSLGVLLLIISFLYNKYKLKISDET